MNSVFRHKNRRKNQILNIFTVSVENDKDFSQKHLYTKKILLKMETKKQKNKKLEEKKWN